MESEAVDPREMDPDDFKSRFAGREVVLTSTANETVRGTVQRVMRNAGNGELHRIVLSGTPDGYQGFDVEFIRRVMPVSTDSPEARADELYRATNHDFRVRDDALLDGEKFIQLETSSRTLDPNLIGELAERGLGLTFVGDKNDTALTRYVWNVEEEE